MKHLIVSKSVLHNATDALVYYTNCAIATFEMTLMIKKYSAADRKRAGDIAQGMVMALETFAAEHPSRPGIKTRYADAFAEYAERFAKERTP